MEHLLFIKGMGLIIAIVWMHVISDFVFQTSYVAFNKSKSNSILTLHAGIYSVLFLVFGLEYALINGALHWIVDYNTSRLTSRFWDKGETHWFFVTIGFDQAIHITCLLVTIPYIRMMF